eukprot:scaffold1285_cov231-Chaetoceros_neogracile.AAC.2
MSNTSSTNKNPTQQSDNSKPKGPGIGVDSNTEGGGVWAQTNAKRDKLGELRLELKFDLGQRTLDDAATSEEKLDLWLVDGIKAVCSFVDGVELRGECVEQLRSSDVDGVPHLDDFYGLLKEFQENCDGGKINKGQYETHLKNLMAHVEQIRTHHPAAPRTSDTEEGGSSTAQSSLVHIRDIMEFTPPNEPIKSTKEIKKKGEEGASHIIPASLEKDLSQALSLPLIDCSEYFHILLLQSCLLNLSERWDDLVRISDADQDRAATTGATLAPLEQVDVPKLHQVLEAFGTKGCAERTEALWNLMDWDDDGLLDQVEMDQVVSMTLQPVEAALKSFVEDCIAVWPLRAGDPFIEDSVGEEMSLQKNKGAYKKWTEKRKEKKAKKVLLKLLDGAIKRHFKIDVEVPHRLRCCYAWADKEHQGGKVQSVLVESTGSGIESDGDSVVDAAGGNSGGGFFNSKKRYVELDPKISYKEFREVQREHFPHLDRITQELCTGFKEEVWMQQGKRRQNAEVKREGLAFLAVVSLIDIGITLS